MTRTVTTLSSLLLGVGFLMLGNGLLGTLLGVRMALAKLPEITIGLVMSGYFIGLALGALRAPSVIAAAGHIRAFSAFASIYSAVSLAHAFFVDPVFWCLLRMVQGFCMAGLFMCVESWLNQRATNENRGSILSIYMIVVYFAQGVAQYFLTLGPLEGVGMFAFVSAAVSIAVVPVALTRMPAPELPEPQPIRFGQLYAISPVGMLGSFASGVILGAFYGMAPAFAPLAGLDIDQTALFMALAILGGLAAQWPVGRLSDVVDRRVMIGGVAVLLAVICTAMALTGGRSAVGLLIGAALFGALGFTLYPLAVAHTNDMAGPADFVPLSSGLLLAYSFGAITGPLGGAAAMEWVGPGGLFGFAALIAAGAAGYTLWRLRRRPTRPEDEQAPFVPVPRTMPTAAALDPRGPEA